MLDAVCNNAHAHFDYEHLFFCAPPSLRPLVFVALLVWLLFLFSTLGISASDFFTPNLATIAQLLGLDENVAGVTFLALGNGSPDLFSTFSAMRAHSGSLAIGELLGAASFIVSCVVGSMCIIKPFKVDKTSFLRDVGFFTLAVTFLLVMLSDNQISAWEAHVLVVFYVVYVAAVVVGSWWERRQEHRRTVQALVRAEYEPDIIEPFTDDPGPSALPPPSPIRVRSISTPNPPRDPTQSRTLPPRPHSGTPRSTPPPHRHTHLPSFSLLGALEFRQVVASLQRQAAGTSLSLFEAPHPLYVGAHLRARTLSHFSSEVPLNERSGGRLLSTGYVSDEPDMIHDSLPSITLTPASPTTPSHAQIPPISDTESDLTRTHAYRTLQILRRIFHTLFPSLVHFRSKSFPGKVASIFAAPAVLALTLTLPVVVIPYELTHAKRENKNAFVTSSTDHGGDGGSGASSNGPLINFEEEALIVEAEEEVQEGMHDLAFNKWLAVVQCVFGPMFCVGVLASGTERFPWLLAAAGIAGFAAAVLVAVFADKGDNAMSRLARCSMGFVVSIVWIMAIADEVVKVLQTFGLIFGLSDAIIGLTIFAVGNSLADLVANMSVAVFAPIMGFSACFGSPMLNILLGVGLSGSYVIHQTSQPYPLHFSNTLLVSTIGLLFLLVVTLVWVPWNGYVLTRRWGMFLIGAYSVIMSLNVLVEMTGHRM